MFHKTKVQSSENKSININVLLQNVRHVENDKNHKAFISIKEINDIYSVIFESKKTAEDFAAVCIRLKANSQANGDTLVFNYPNNHSQFVVYLSHKDIAELLKSGYPDEHHVMRGLNIKGIKKVEPNTQYLFTVNNLKTAWDFLKKNKMLNSEKNPGETKQIYLHKEKKFFFSYIKSASFYLSSKEVQRLNDKYLEDIDMLPFTYPHHPLYTVFPY